VCGILNFLLSRPEPSGLVKVATRASLRLAGVGRTVEYSELPDDWDESAQSKTRKRRPSIKREQSLNDTNENPQNRDVPIKKSKETARSAKKITMGQPDSSRNLLAEISLLETYIGKLIPGGHVKAGVMQFVSPSCEPRFSKYIGELGCADRLALAADSYFDLQECKNGVMPYFS
jgi:hypothetical protein